MRIPIIGTIHEGLDFAVRRYSDVLRLSWLPLVLLTFGLPGLVGWMERNGYAGPIALGSLAVAGIGAVVLQSSYMVALIRAAAHGEPPHHRSAHLAFGLREFRFALVSILTLFAVLLLSVGPASVGAGILDGFLNTAETKEIFTFAEGSLHDGQRNLLYPDGHPARGLMPAFYILAGLVFLYAGLRLFLWPVFLAAGDSGAPAPLGLTLKASAGLNVFVLAVILLFYGIVQFIVGVSARLMMALGAWVGAVSGMALTALAAWGLDFASPEWAEGVSNNLAFVVAGVTAILVNAFVAGLFAGLGGSIVRRVRHG